MRVDSLCPWTKSQKARSLFCFSFFIFILVSDAYSGSRSVGFFKCLQALSSTHKAQLSPTGGYTFEDWQDAYRKAEADGNTMAGAFSFARLIGTHSRSLGLSWGARIALQAYTRAFEDRDILTDIAPSDPTALKKQGSLGERLHNGFIRRGYFTDNILNYPRRYDALGNNYSPRNALHSIIANLLRSYLWTNAIMGVRPILEMIERSLVSKMVREVKELVSRSDSPLLDQIGIQDSPFLRLVLKEHYEIPGLVRQRIAVRQRGSLLLPWLQYLVMIFIGKSFGVHLNLIDALEYRTHPSQEYTDFIKQAQTRIDTSLEKKNVLYIVDTDLINATLPQVTQETVRSVAPSQQVELNDMRQRYTSSHFRVVPVHSFYALNQVLDTDLSQTDVLFLNIHGRPGRMVIGQEELEDHMGEIHPRSRLKEGAVVVFLSCQFGDRYISHNSRQENEEWVILARRLLGRSGYAIASTSSISFRAEHRDNFLRTQEEQDAARMQGFVLFGDWVFSSLYTKPFDVFEEAIESSRHVYRGQVGIRVYDASTGRVRDYLE